MYLGGDGNLVGEAHMWFAADRVCDIHATTDVATEFAPGNKYWVDSATFRGRSLGADWVFTNALCGLLEYACFRYVPYAPRDPAV